MERASKVLAVGLDAAEPSLLREWAHAGYLPTMRRLIDSGCSTDLTSPALQFPDAVWPTRYTSRQSGHQRPAVEDVSIMRDCYDGARRSWLPDLTALWSAEHPIDALYSPGYGTVIGSHRDARTGGRAPRGFLAMTNHSVKPQLDNADVPDIAPTILRLLDVPIPAGIEGHSLLRVEDE